MTKRALISVSDKTGLIPFATRVVGCGFEIVSTGGTARTLREAGITAVEVSQVTGFPEILSGRVKTLHPKIHGGLLARRDDADHQRQARENQIEMIDVVVINLYPFRETVSRRDVNLNEAKIGRAHV